MKPQQKIVVLGKPPKNWQKISQQLWTISKNGEPPSPYFTTISATFGTWKSMVFFAIIKSLWMRRIDKNKIGDLFKIKL